MTENTERQLIALIAADRISIPIKSLSGKLDRQKPKLAKAVEFDGTSYFGDRVHARLEIEDVTEKARTMREAIDAFAQQYPRYGTILNGMIEETRAAKETNLYFGMNDGCRLTSGDYMQVMRDIGFSEARAESMYQELMEVSRNISRRRQESERSILVG